MRDMTDDRRKTRGVGVRRAVLPAVLIVLFGIIVGDRVRACEVDDVDLYVAENEAGAVETTDLELFVCAADTPYWFRVVWHHFDGGEGGDNPFHVEVHDTTEDITLWEDEDIADDDSEDEYSMEVQAEVNSPESALSLGAHNLRAYARRIGVGEWVESNQATVTFQECTQGAKYADASKSVGNVVGASATIKTRWGKLCCEDCLADVNALSAAYADGDNGGSKWGQGGYLKYRTVGSSTTNKRYYAEVMGNTRWIYVSGTPTEGSSHTYKCELTKSTGTWKFYIDGSFFQQRTDSYWLNKTCDRAYWSGEIHNKEDDMAGTSSDKCNFTNCQYKQDGGSYQNAGLTSGNLFTDDSTEWGVEDVNGTAFNIWDKDPLD